MVVEGITKYRVLLASGARQPCSVPGLPPLELVERNMTNNDNKPPQTVYMNPLRSKGPHVTITGFVAWWLWCCCSSSQLCSHKYRLEPCPCRCRPKRRPTAWRRRSPRYSKRSRPSIGDVPRIRTSLLPSTAKIVHCWSDGARRWSARATSDRRMSLCRR